MNETELMATIAALFSMMNPVGNVGIFAGLTADYSEEETRSTAIRSAIATGITLLTVIWSGGLLLSFFGVNVNELRAAGGVIIMVIGLNMLFNKDDHKTSGAEKAEAKERTSIAIVPIAIPLLAGPGTITTALVGAERYPDVMSKLEMSVVVILLSLLVGVLFIFARPIAKRLGRNGMAVVTRLMVALIPALGQ